MAPTDKIQVEIWSDVQCPFCYIGKRQFEAALEDFEGKDRVEITWKSYQLDPGLKAQPGETIYAYLARRKGMTVDQSRQMHDRVAQSAAAVGLNYQFEKMIVANSHAAHRLIQAAKAQGLGDEAEEALFQAYFTEGKDLGDKAQLTEIGDSLGMAPGSSEEAITDLEGTWGRRVDDEASEGMALGSTGVPFFVFQRQYSVTGAQGVATFRKVLDKIGRETAPA
jgi:protein disulfide-isomerase